MKKTLTLGALIIAGFLLAGCTLQVNRPTTNSTNNTMMSGGSMNHNMGNMGCCSNSGDSMNNSMIMHTVKSEEEFIVNMIPHHQEAVDTAKIVVANSTNSELKKLAQNIIDAQNKEITMMKGRLEQWYPNSTLKSDYQNMMPELTTLTGNALDSAFLQGMIMHHMGAIHMAQSVLQVKHKAETMELANNIIATQQQEITVMRNILQNIK